MLPKSVKGIIWLVILGSLGWTAFSLVRDYSSQELGTIRRYNDALNKDESQRFNALCATDAARAAFQFQEERDKAIPGEICWTFYKIKKKVVQSDGQAATVIVRQTIRYNPPNVDGSFWGIEKVVNNQEFNLVRDRSSWKVKSFRDKYYYPGIEKNKSGGS